MPLIPLIIIAVLFLVGAIALAIGHKGWSWGTVAAAWLVLLSAVGFFALVGMLGQREREWRKVVNTYQAALVKEREALVPATGTALRPDPSSKSLVVLEDERKRWSRVLDRINTWRGRHWDRAAFVPPANGQPGSITIEGIENATINSGAELYVFDTTPIEQGGRFVGAFRVESADKNVFTVSTISVPDAADQRALAMPRGEVAVYEDLPIDRSFAFYRTPVPAAPGTEGADPAATLPDPSNPVPGRPSKSDPEEMLKHLELKLEEFRLHDTVVGGAVAAEDPLASHAEESAAAGGDDGSAVPGSPTAVARTVSDPTQSETPPPGVHWARVVFNADFSYTWPDGTLSRFKAGDLLPSLPAEQVATLKKEGAEFTSTWSIPPGLYWANVEFKQPHSFPRKQGEALEFDSGRTAMFDLDSAKTLEKEGVVAITAVIFRRPLADGNVALRGAGAFQVDGDGKGPSLPIDVNGLVVMRRILEEDKRSIDSSIKQLELAKTSTQKEIADRQQEQAELADDLTHWKSDVTAADRSAGAFAARLAGATRDLAASENSVVELGRELADAVATLSRAIDQSAPPPDNPLIPADAGR
ncbi:MAG: hypothetical protein DWH79_07630 [Planctomycetota bacterium]|nr:MAG: hypothetical protein DWH79_07630 [Planctomycetota bacterium]